MGRQGGKGDDKVTLGFQGKPDEKNVKGKNPRLTEEKYLAGIGREGLGWDNATQGAHFGVR